MKTTFMTGTGLVFEISSKFLGNKNWDSASIVNKNNHEIIVKNADTGNQISFEFWNSVAAGYIKKEEELINAFYCLVSEALFAVGTFEDLCAELGYNKDSRKDYKIYNACREQSVKLAKIYEGDIYDLSNELNEVVNG